MEQLHDKLESFRLTSVILDIEPNSDFPRHFPYEELKGKMGRGLKVSTWEFHTEILALAATGGRMSVACF